jgi:hypothetical protein
MHFYIFFSAVHIDWFIKQILFSIKSCVNSYKKIKKKLRV